MSTGGTVVEREEPRLVREEGRRTGAWGRWSGLGMAVARNMFGLDYRSLALFRMGLGICLLWVAYVNAWEMRAFYTDEGVLPRTALFANPGEFLGFSLYFADGGMPYVATLFGLQFVFALMMLVGYRTRVATVGSYILLLSMQNREPVLLFGADIALRVGLFWAMFLPLARRYSVDRSVGRVKGAPEVPYLGVAGIAMIAQVAAIYMVGALMKEGPTWQVDHTAVGYALALDVYSRPLGHWLGQFEGLTRMLTITTLYLELYGPWLFVLPVFSKWGRMAGIAMFAGLQISFGLCMTMGIFGTVMITLTVMLLPAFFWERMAEPLGRRVAGKVRGVAGWGGLGRLWEVWAERQRARHARAVPAAKKWWLVGLGVALVREGVVALLLVVMVLGNWGNLPWAFKSRAPASLRLMHLSPGFEKLEYTVGLNQRWDMFAPDPQTIDGWFVVVGNLHNGETVDLMSGATPASFDKPADVAGSYQSMVWMSYLISYWNDDGTSPEPFARFVGTRWNETHTGDERVESVEINMMVMRVGPGLTKSEVERRQVWVQWF